MTHVYRVFFSILLLTSTLKDSLIIVIQTHAQLQDCKDEYLARITPNKSRSMRGKDSKIIAPNNKQKQITNESTNEKTRQ